MPPANTAESPNEIGSAFAAMRKEAKIPQTRLAARVGISPGHLSRFEKGQRTIARPTYDALIEALAQLAREGQAA